ncbi:MAG: hypothetical protein ABIO04_05795 [Ferruginibacter sp.]
MKQYFLFFLAFTLFIGFNSCKKSNEEFKTASLDEYYPLTPGKYITYSLDSTIYVNFGASAEVHSYEVKFEVDAQITDNLGRPAYRIFRYIRNPGAGAWAPDATFTAVNDSTGLEFIENNLRYLKLKQPVRDNYTWKGNTYIDTYSINSPVKYLDDWDYVYENVGITQQVGTFTFDNTLTVNQRDEIIGNPADINSYAEINYSLEKYAAGIGMVYRQFLHTEYQPPVPGLEGHYVDGSYGVTYTIIDHN